MRYSIVYSSKTGNTAQLAEEIYRCLPEGKCVYCGAPGELIPDADFIFAGFWTDKGNCDESMTVFLRELRSKEVFLFGTAGFGGEQEYFDRILSRVEENIDASNTVAGSYMCQGKMPLAVRRRYEAMSAENPKGAEKMLDNFDRALTHPDLDDLKLLEEQLSNIIK